jgi:hypothetical protein
MSIADAMQTLDKRWRVEVGGLGTSVIWYRLIGPGVGRALPSTQALLDALAEAGIDLAELDEAPSAGRRRLPGP